jgi:hypothetical protein
VPDRTERSTFAISPPGPPLHARSGLSGLLDLLGSVAFAIFGLAVLTAGVMYMATGLAKIATSAPGSPLRTHAWIFVGASSILPIAGLVFLALGLSSMAGRRRLARLAAAHPGEPWYGDYEWNPKGQRQRLLGAITDSLAGVGLVVLVASPFNYWAFGIGGPGALVGLVIVVDLLVVARAASVGLRVLRKLRFGGAFIRYARFPFFLGERLEVCVGIRWPPPAGVPLTARLRFIKERFGSAGGDITVSHYQTYVDERTVAFDGVSPEVTLTFPLPDGDYLTELAVSQRCWWELRLDAKMHGAELDAHFVIPVYRRP